MQHGNTIWQVARSNFGDFNSVTKIILSIPLRTEPDVTTAFQPNCNHVFSPKSLPSKMMGDIRPNGSCIDVTSFNISRLVANLWGITMAADVVTPFSTNVPTHTQGFTAYFRLNLFHLTLTLSQWSSSGNPVCLELRPQCTLECHWRKNCW